MAKSDKTKRFVPDNHGDKAFGNRATGVLNSFAEIVLAFGVLWGLIKSVRPVIVYVIAGAVTYAAFNERLVSWLESLTN